MAAAGDSGYASDMWKRSALAFLAASIALFPAVANDPPGGQGKGKGKGKGEARAAAAPGARFASGEVQMIREYYTAHPVSLPPGLQKKPAPGKALPPGWQKKLTAFPGSLEGRLAPVCATCGRGVIDGYAVIYDKQTRIVLDIVQLVGDILR